ncbi:cache domain-containing protein [Marinobacterium aestuariivivens]|uniref:Cache domain-containing protein n=1 Tax=Marinobacterium aestuariivivens TaxID=1698799 RepID=A0ABW1ZY99_9GAMM
MSEPPAPPRHPLIGRPCTIRIVTLVLVALLWLVLMYEQARNREAVEREALNGAANLTRTFEEHVVRTFHDVDAALLLLRRAWETDRGTFEEWVRLLGEAYDEALLVQIAVIGPGGRLAYSNLDPDAKPVDLSDREHFRVHKDRTEDALFISKPVKGRVSGRYSIQMTRPIPNERGGFGGVLVISLSPDYFSEFFATIDLGENGSIALIGTDGIFRARGSRSQMDVEAIGRSVPPGRPFMQADAPAAGYYRVRSSVDGIERLISYRQVADYPMVVAVTKAVDEVFAAHEQRWRYYQLGAGLISLLMFVGGYLLARSLRFQQRYQNRLVEQQARLQFANDSLRTLNDIATHSGDNLAAKLQRALTLGCRHLGVEFGIISQVAGGFIVSRPAWHRRVPRCVTATISS